MDEKKEMNNKEAKNKEAKSKVKIIVAAIVFFLAIIVGLIVVVIVNNTEENVAALPWNDFATVKVGDTVTFGKFDGEPIQWDVLDKDDESVLLISHYVLTYSPYSQLSKDDDRTLPTNWKVSLLRKYLNGEFYDTSFTTEEQASIQTVKITNTSSEEFFKTYFPEDLFEKNPKQCGETKDKIYCLSWEELIKYYGIEEGESRKKSEEISQYAYNAIATDTNMTKNRDWWLRSSGRKGQFVITVNEYGRVGYANAYVMNLGVRPVLRVCIK